MPARRNFYPRPPRGGRLQVQLLSPAPKIFLSTPSARRATIFTRSKIINTAISIHALREEGDLHHFHFVRWADISIHALREEGDIRKEIKLCWINYFYPRPPRGGRPGGLDAPHSQLYFYPRPPRGGRPGGLDAPHSQLYFYPRPPRGGRRRFHRGRHASSNFYPRPPRGGRPTRCSSYTCKGAISIHALREEGDSQRASPARHLRDFYPRPPRGGRLVGDNGVDDDFRFLSTPSARRATRRGCCLTHIPSDFYPRPPRGGRLQPGISPCCTRKFLSTPSARRATAFHCLCKVSGGISIHALREEGDRSPAPACPTLSISIHALREEGDQSCTLNLPCHENFYPRPPRGGRR